MILGADVIIETGGYHEVVMRATCVLLLALLAVGCVGNRQELVYAPRANSIGGRGVVEVRGTREPYIVGPAPRHEKDSQR
jgi:hypothetical protein